MGFTIVGCCVVFNCVIMLGYCILFVMKAIMLRFTVMKVIMLRFTVMKVIMLRFTVMRVIMFRLSCKEGYYVEVYCNPFLLYFRRSR